MYSSTGVRYFPCLEDIRKASVTVREVAPETPLQHSQRLSLQYGCQVYLKREDLQLVRSYKIRGAYNHIHSLEPEKLKRGVVCASAGNHAQGVAYACSRMGVTGHIFMPEVTPRQKVEQTRLFGGPWISTHLTGDSFDASQTEALAFAADQGLSFVHPFDHPRTIEGQGTIGLEIIDRLPTAPDFVIAAIGGGGLASGLCAVFSELAPTTRIIGVEPSGAPSMSASIQKGELVTLDRMDSFVDGAAVRRVGELTFNICRHHLDRVLLVEEGAICQSILSLYNRDAIVVEPAGAMGITALDQLAGEIRGKTVVVIVGGSNNDISRMSEIKERALLYGRLKHYFIIRFPQRPGALREFVDQILGPTDDITFFEYSKKSYRENAPAVVGVELQDGADLEPLIERMKAHNFFGEYLNDKPDLFQYLV